MNILRWIITRTLFVEQVGFALPWVRIPWPYFYPTAYNFFCQCIKSYPSVCVRRFVRWPHLVGMPGWRNVWSFPWGWYVYEMAALFFAVGYILSNNKIFAPVARNSFLLLLIRSLSHSHRCFMPILNPTLLSSLSAYLVPKERLQLLTNFRKLTHTKRTTLVKCPIIVIIFSKLSPGDRTQKLPE